jgi:regulatory protein
MSERRTPKRLGGQELLAYGLKVLSMRALSSGEVRNKLRLRAESEEDVEPVLEKLRGFGFLNDTKFAESYAATRRDTQGFGKNRVLRDLRTRRVAPKLAEKIVAETYAQTDEVQMIESFLERKYRSTNLSEYLQDERKLVSVYRRLRNAGFGGSPAIQVLRRYAAQADQLEDEVEPDV